MKTILSFIFIVSITIVGCKEPSSTDSEDASSISNEEVSHDFDLQGHRGARGLFPENSIEGFVSAVDLLVNTLEMDVVISKDKKVVVSHEPWINSKICWGLNDKPVPEGKGLNMYQLTYDEISNYNCGSQPHPDFPLQAKMPTFKPLLSEVISEVESTVLELELAPIEYNIEIKSTPETDNVFHPGPKEFVQLVLDQIVKGGIKERTTLQSFDVRALREVKELDASIPVALLISDSDGFEKDLENLGFTPEVYSPNFRIVDENIVRSCRKNHIRLIPWTVNEEEDMQRMLELGVDGLITDYPDVALTLKL